MDVCKNKSNQQKTRAAALTDVLITWSRTSVTVWQSPLKGARLHESSFRQSRLICGGGQLRRQPERLLVGVASATPNISQSDQTMSALAGVSP